MKRFRCKALEEDGYVLELRSGEIYALEDQTKAENISVLFQAIPGNDQNASPTNQKTAGSKLDRTSYLMFYGSWRHLESFSGGFLVRICLLGCLLRHLVKSSVFNGTTFE